MKKTCVAGQRYGKWSLGVRLGEGGNGEVWTCKNTEGTVYAIKILKSIRQKAYQRFIDEATVIRQNADVPGLLPIMDYFLPSDPRGRAPFYVMPVAANSESELASPSLAYCVTAIRQIADTLRILHQRGISHRDIKPGNILYYQDRFVLADFGLVEIGRAHV